MTKPSTQAERMQHIETLVKSGFENIATAQVGMTENWKEVIHELAAIRAQMAADKKELEKEVQKDVADLARLKNIGIGLLIAAGAAGVTFADAVKNIWRMVTGG